METIAIRTSIPVFRPYSDESEIQAASAVLESGWWGQGLEAEALESEFCAYLGAAHAVAVNSATSGLHLALLAAGVGAGDEVITTPLTFASTAAAIRYVGAIPVFADVNADDLCLDPADVEKRITRRTKVILPVHYGGNAADLSAFGLLADLYDLTLLEDAAHAAGASYQGQRIGADSSLAVFSFHAVKNIASPDGGMVVTDNAAWAGRMKRLRWLGIDKDTHARNNPNGYAWEYEIDEVGFKYQMPDVTAAIARVQLRRLDTMNDRRRRISEGYASALSDLDWLDVPYWFASSACHLFVVRCDDRDELANHLRGRGISTGVHYKPLHRMNAFHAYGVNLPVVEREWRRILSLPLFPGMSDNDVDYVIEAVRDFRI
jgi:perosamine synthetase